MNIYYLDAEYEPGKHNIIKVYSEYVDRIMPEDSPDTIINVSYAILELEEKYNRLLARNLLTNHDEYYIDNTGNIRDSKDNLITIYPNPQKESYKLSALYGMTQTELETYIDTNITNLVEAKLFLKKLAAVTLWLIKQTGMDA